MSTEPTLTYPVIMAEHHDEGDYVTVTSPNIPGMVTEGRTHQQAAESAIDAIATMLDGEPYPEPQDPSGWSLADGERSAYVTVGMAQWYREKAAWQAAGSPRPTPEAEAD
ncbi:type II toxin-antitoxin system HicB family antitoxin [Lacticaseibacillus kribbianus]|uniref:type II toxin-antitoxin system HicB family antitoxin n=1 Tax=Lacticaseibacillus kribbianus TaxID=2926292 RepID=UPI001CD775CF|nr:type II toxin-antitoxin system HicB family antitoxin [Lacticaseibacillus kribbianus]